MNVTEIDEISPGKESAELTSNNEDNSSPEQHKERLVSESLQTGLIRSIKINYMVLSVVHYVSQSQHMVNKSCVQKLENCYFRTGKLGHFHSYSSAVDSESYFNGT